MTTKTKDWEIRKLEKTLGNDKSEKMLVACDEDSVADAAMALKLMLKGNALGEKVKILMLAGVTLARFRKAFGDEALLDGNLPVQSEFSSEKNGYLVRFNIDKKNCPYVPFVSIIH